jgi:type IV pilus assembly protein PilO
MADLRMPQSQREQVMVIIGFLGIAAAGLYWNYVYSPTMARVVADSAKIDTLDKQIASYKRQVAQGTESKLREQTASFGANLAVVRTFVPTANELPTLLDQFSTAARRAGLDVGRIAPMSVEGGVHFDAYRYELTVTGGYHDIAEFITNVASLDRIVVPINMQMIMTPNQGPRPDPKKTVTTSFQLHTYVAKIAPPPKAGG